MAAGRQQGGSRAAAGRQQGGEGAEEQGADEAVGWSLSGAGTWLGADELNQRRVVDEWNLFEGNELVMQGLEQGTRESRLRDVCESKDRRGSSATCSVVACSAAACSVAARGVAARVEKSYPKVSMMRRLRGCLCLGYCLGTSAW